MPNTIRLHRVLATSPEKVYRAFLEAAFANPPYEFRDTFSNRLISRSRFKRDSRLIQNRPFS